MIKFLIAFVYLLLFVHEHVGHNGLYHWPCTSFYSESTHLYHGKPNHQPEIHTEFIILEKGLISRVCQ